MCLIGTNSVSNRLYTTALPSYEAAIETLHLEQSGHVPDEQILDHFGDDQVNRTYINQMHKRTILFHDEKLVRQILFSGLTMIFPHLSGWFPGGAIFSMASWIRSTMPAKKKGIHFALKS